MRRNWRAATGSSVDSAADSQARAFRASLIETGRLFSSAVNMHALPCQGASSGVTIRSGGVASRRGPLRRVQPCDSSAAKSRVSGRSSHLSDDWIGGTALILLFDWTLSHRNGVNPATGRVIGHTADVVD